MKNRKILYVICMTILFIGIFNDYSFAKDPATDINMVLTSMDGAKTVENNGGKISIAINKIIGIIQYVGSAVSIIVVTILGGKYMLASTGEKADIKKQAMPIVIGCVILFSAVNLVQIISEIGEGL